MDNDKFESQVAFILEQQARFAANLAKQHERDAQVNKRLDRVDRKLEKVANALLALTAHVERHDQQIERHDQQIERHDQQMAEINRGLAELVERGKETDARLNALMLVVERHISDHQ